MSQLNSLETIQATIRPQLSELNTQIREALMSSNSLMNKVVEGYLTTKGKQIRPIMVILAAKALGTINANVIKAAAAVEMLHNASLIHDDVVDESKTRRGNPTINSVWDNHIAVLVGDFFVSNALQQAISTGDIRIIGSIAALGKLLSLGEIDQIYNARFHNLTQEAYFEVISRKTASLFVACVEMGAYAVGRSDGDKAVEALRAFAEKLGRCFQVRDDIFDYFDDPSIGKPTGNDLREGKVTLPLLYALSVAPEAEAEAMKELCAAECISDREIARLTDFALRHGGIDYAYCVMKRMRDEAVAELTAALPANNDAVKAFTDIFDYIITRKN